MGILWVGCITFEASVAKMVLVMQFCLLLIFKNYLIHLIFSFSELVTDLILFLSYLLRWKGLGIWKTDAVLEQAWLALDLSITPFNS
jgi:hypothetical protein